MNSAADRLRARNLRTLAGLAGLFLLPLALAFVLYYATDWRPAAHTNHGRLITPVRPLPLATLQRPERATADAPGARSQPAAPLFRHQWSLVYVGDGACDRSCRAALYAMRQTRLSLNNDMTRVARVFLVTGGCCDREFLAREHPGLVVVNAGGAGSASLLRLFPDADRAHTLFVVDPLGNLMMSYDVRGDPRGLRDDLKNLLRLSQIG